MPLGFKQVNGRWVTTGGTTAEEEVPQELAPATPRQRVTAKAKPKAKPKTGFDKLRNDLLYEAKRIGQPGGLQRAAKNLAFEVLDLDFSGERKTLAQVVGAVGDATQMADALYQRQILKRPKAIGSPATAAIDLGTDAIYKALGVKPPSEMNRKEYEYDKNARAITTSLLLALVPGAGLGVAAAKTAAGTFVRSGAAFALNEALSTYLTDNRAGNISNLVAGLTGQNIPSAVTPQDDLVDAANKSLVPNALASAGLGLAADLAVKGIKRLPATAKAIRDRRTVAKVTASRAELDSAGHTITDPETGASRFNPLAAVDAAKNMQEANAAIATWIGDTKAAVDAKQAVDAPAVAAYKAGRATPAPAAPAPAAPATAPTGDWLTPDTYSKEKPPLPPMEGPMVDPWTGRETPPPSAAKEKFLAQGAAAPAPDPAPAAFASPFTVRAKGPEGWGWRSGFPAGESPPPTIRATGPAEPSAIQPYLQTRYGTAPDPNQAAMLPELYSEPRPPGGGEGQSPTIRVTGPTQPSPVSTLLQMRYGAGPDWDLQMAQNRRALQAPELPTGEMRSLQESPAGEGQSPTIRTKGPDGWGWRAGFSGPTVADRKAMAAAGPTADALQPSAARPPAGPVQRALGAMESSNPSPSRAEPPADAAPQVDANASGLDSENLDAEPPIYDPALPEADVVAEAVKKLSDAELVAAVDVVARTGADPVEVIEQIASSRIRPEPGTGPNPRLRAENVMAPEVSVSELVTGDYEGQLRAMGEEQLRDLVHPDNSPDLSAFIENNAGKEYEDLDLGDMLAGLEAWRAYSGEVAIPREYSSLDVVRVADLRVDPATYQYKQSVDAEGVQSGGALEGVGRWNPALEGVVEVWDNPVTGTLDVVNGHHRVAKAKELGIPTIPVRRIVARDAAEARAMGAAANIASGSGTNFDAAKFLRDFGITSPKQLDAIGASLSSGKVGDGFALARLPKDMFRDAVDGLLPEKFAIAMGKAGLDEPTTRALYGALKKNPGMGEDAFSQLVQLGQGLREAAPRAAAGGAQPTIPGMEEMFSDLVPKANLLSAIETELKRQKTTASRVVRDAERLTEIGNQIDVGSTKAAGKETRDLLDVFKRDKLLAGPLSDLLNDGTAEVVGGAKVKPIADRIIGQFRRLVEQGIEPAVTPTTVMPQGGRYGGGRTPITDGFAGDLNELGQVLASGVRTTEQLLQFGGRQLDRQEGQILAQADELQQQGLLDMPPQVASLAEARQADFAAQAREPAPLAVTALPPELRQQTTNALVGDAIVKGSVRPPATPTPELSPGPALDLDTAAQALDELAASGGPIEPGSIAAQAAADEVRFKLESFQQDAQISQVMHEAASDAAGLELQPFAEKQGLLGDGFDRPMAVEPAAAAAEAPAFAPIDPTKTLKGKDRDLVMDQFRVDPQRIIDDANGKVFADKWGGTSDNPIFAAWVGGQGPGREGTETLAEGLTSLGQAQRIAEQYRQKEIARAVSLIEQARAASTPTLAPAPVKPETVSLASGATATPTQIRARFSDAQERAIFNVAKTIPEIDGRTLFGNLRAGRFDAGQARQLVDAAKKVSKPPAVLKKAIAKLEEALGVPTAIKADSANIQSELGANKAKKDALKNQAAKEGC